MNEKILIVDDNESIRTVYKTMLDSQGYEVGIAEDGEQALEQLKKEDYQLVLLDIMMPKLDGLHVLETIKTTPKISDVKVIMLSALYDDAIKETAKKAGAIDYIIKADSDMNDVLQKIATALSR